MNKFFILLIFLMGFSLYGVINLDSASIDENTPSDGIWGISFFEIKNPCDGKTCSNHGRCIIDSLTTKHCKCDDGYQDRNKNMRCEVGCEVGFTLIGGSCIKTSQWGTSKDDLAKSLSIDSNNNVYITGSTYGSLDGNTSMGYSDIFLTKFNSNGKKEWRKQWGTSSIDRGNSLSIDSNNNIFVTGMANGSVFLTKFNSDGKKEWIKQWGSSNKEGTSLSIDSNDNIFVIGKLDSKYTERNIFLTKFNSNGKKEWTKEFGNPYERGNSLSIDSNNNIFVTGMADSYTYDSRGTIFLTKFNSKGVKQWRKQWGTSNNDKGVSISVDSNNNIFITGRSNENIFLTKFNSDGVKEWTKQWGTSEFDQATSLSIDSNNNILITGYTYGSFDGFISKGESDIFLTKFNNDGVKEWTKQWGTSSIDSGNSLSIDSNNNIYITGSTSGSLDGKKNSGSSDIFLTKLYKEIPSQIKNPCNGKTCSNHGSCIVDSSTRKHCKCDDGYQDRNKNMRCKVGCEIGFTLINRSCIKTSQWGTSQDDKAHSLSVDSNDNIFITGSTGSFNVKLSPKMFNIFLTKFNSKGVKEWTSQWGTSSIDSGNSLSIDSNNNIYITGSTSGSLDGNTSVGYSDIFLTKFNSKGVKKWTKQWGTSSIDSGNSLSIDSNNNIYITGSTSGSLDGNKKSGSSDIFLTKFNSKGIKEWTKQWGTSRNDKGVSLSIDNNDNIFITGFTSGSLDGNKNAGNSDIFLTKFNSKGVKEWTRQWGDSKYNLANSLSIDSDNNIFITGSSNEEIFLTKLNSNGVKQWTKHWENTGSDFGTSVSIDINNNIFVTGYTYGSLDENKDKNLMPKIYLHPKSRPYRLSSDIFLTKFNSKGVKQWTKQWGIPFEDDRGTSICIDSRNHVFITGRTNGSLSGSSYAGGKDIFLTEFKSEK